MSKEKKSTKRGIIITIVTFMIILLLSIVLVTACTGKFFGFNIRGTIDQNEVNQLIEESKQNMGAPEQTTPVIANGDKFSGDVNDMNVHQTQAQKGIVIPGYSALVTDKAHGNIKLVNPPGNEVLFKYTISSNDSVVYVSDYILPDNQIYWNVLNAFNNSGTYELTFKIETIDQTTYTACNGATQTVSLTIL